MAAVITAAHCVVDTIAGYTLTSVEVLVGAYEFPDGPRAFGVDPGIGGSHYESVAASDVDRPKEFLSGKTVDHRYDIAVLKLQRVIAGEVVSLYPKLGESPEQAVSFYRLKWTLW